MGIFRRSSAPTLDVAAVASAVADHLKAASTPSPADRAAQFTTTMFGPGVPFIPAAIDPRDPVTGRPDPRRSDFATSVNLNVNATRLMPFGVLRDVAEKVDIIRRCIEVRKAQMLALDWDITLTDHATRRVMRDQGIDSPGRAAQVARQQFEPEIIRLREWWEKPDRLNGQDFATWLGVLLEEQLVIDAVTIWPRRKFSGEVVGLEILDGSTIKPLLDHRGATPVPPAPAFQQVLKGFPRGEFVASDAADDAYEFGQLVYRPRHRRTWTPYGLPETEQALASADVYLRRMAWIRGEFVEGRTQDSWMLTPESSTMTPAQMREWETALNADNADPSARRALRMTPPGVKPQRMNQFAELYKAELDEFLIKLLCTCFDVMPTEIGFPPNSGIGGKGHQEGEANSAWRKAVRPTAIWLSSLLTDLSRQFLGMPAELQFTMIGYEVEDQESAEKVADSQTRRGALTLNEDRARRGLTMFEFAEADKPFIVTPSGLVFLDGAIAAQAAALEAPVADHAPNTSATDPRPTDNPTVAADGVVDHTVDPDPSTPQAGDPIGDNEPVPDGFIRVGSHLRAKPRGAAAAEGAKFVKFVEGRHGRSWRTFEFDHIDPAMAAELNDAGFAGDIDAVKALVATLGKAKARRVTGRAKAALVAEHAPRIRQAIAALLPAPSTLADKWADRQAAVKAADDQRHAATMFVQEQIDLTDDIYDDLDGELDDYLKAGHRAAWEAAWIGEWDEEEDPAPATGSRLAALLDSVPGLRDAAIAVAIGVVADALLSSSPDDNVAAALGDGAEWADTFATVELTASLTAGTLDSAQAQTLAVVQLVASAGDCEFCSDYDGRIMHLDDDGGMPPLHNGCQCDIEPLEPLDD